MDDQLQVVDATNATNSATRYNHTLHKVVSYVGKTFGTIIGYVVRAVLYVLPHRARSYLRQWLTEKVVYVAERGMYSNFVQQDAEVAKQVYTFVAANTKWAPCLDHIASAARDAESLRKVVHRLPAWDVFLPGLAVDNPMRYSARVTTLYGLLMNKHADNETLRLLLEWFGSAKNAGHTGAASMNDVSGSFVCEAVAGSRNADMRLRLCALRMLRDLHKVPVHEIIQWQSPFGKADPAVWAMALLTFSADNCAEDNGHVDD